MKNVFLIGLPSSGKSVIGLKLAEILGYRFIDLDKAIEMDQEMTIPEIFEQKGEAHFRNVESALLQAIAPGIGLVVATGGGAPCFFDNMDYIRQNGRSVFLDLDPHIIASRIRKSKKDDRPLLSGVVELEEELEKKHRERFPFYSQADITVAGETSAEHVVELLLALK